MLDKAKYIIVEKMGCESAILFPSFLQHQYMARMMNAEPKDVISAGMVRFDSIIKGSMMYPKQVVKVICSGGSVSLKIDSSFEEDADIIRKQFIDTE